MQRSPGEGNGNALQYPCLENPMDRGAWRAAAHPVAKSWARLSTRRVKGLKSLLNFPVPFHQRVPNCSFCRCSLHLFTKGAGGRCFKWEQWTFRRHSEVWRLQKDNRLFSPYPCNRDVRSRESSILPSAGHLWYSIIKIFSFGVGDGQGGLACCDLWGAESDTTERLNAWMASPTQWT